MNKRNWGKLGIAGQQQVILEVLNRQALQWWVPLEIARTLKIPVEWLAEPLASLVGTEFVYTEGGGKTLLTFKITPAGRAKASRRHKTVTT